MLQRQPSDNRAECIAADGVRQHGVYVVRTLQLANLVGPQNSRVLERLASQIKGRGAAAVDDTIEGDALLAIYPDVYFIGLAEPLLDLAEDYLGASGLYLGATLKREMNNARVAGTRQWHMDVEDNRMLRLLIYLSPVGPGSGPFEYMPLVCSTRIRRENRYRSGFIDDVRMLAMAGTTNSTEVYGALGDAVLFDGTSVFHRAQTPRIGDRYSLTLAYVSRSPLELRLTARLSKRSRQGVLSKLSPRAAAYIPPARSV
ncbi:MAG: hypothetical protein ACRYG4_17935 [Janthinobacterium lividum]